jgi:predicted metal-dependent RNase
VVKNLQFVALGGANEVGQNCFLLGDGERWIMLDCGLSPKSWTPPNFEFLNKIKDRLAAILISHAHSDHVGGLPFLFAWMKRNGWICLPEVVSTPVTKAIGEVLLRDVFRISKVKEQEASYNLQDMEDLLSEKTWETLYYDDPQERRIKEVSERVLVQFIDANHIPGSACIVINWDGFSILYTGDCCNSKTRFPGELTGWKPYEPVIVISESTYGQEVHLGPGDNDVLGAEDKLIKDIRETLKGEGRVLIPVFAVGRAEEIMLTVADALKKGRFPHVKCYSIGLQNRLVNAVLEVATKSFEANCKKMQEYASKLVLIRDTFSQILFVRGEAQVDKETEANQEFLALRSDNHPMIIVATDGRLGGTSASANLASKMLDEPNSRIIIVAYQDEDSPAYRLLDNIDELKETARQMGKEEKQLEQVVLQTRVRSHILPKALVELLKQVGPETVMLVHGTNESKIHLGNLLTQNAIPVWYTKVLQTVHINCETGQVGTEPFDKPVEQVSLPLEAGRDAFIKVKKWLSEASGVAAVRISEFSAPVFDLGENLRGTPRPGYYCGQEIWVNPEIPPDALNSLLIHTNIHYIMDLLNVSPKSEEPTFQERVFMEGAAEYVAFQLTGKALTDCVDVGDDGKEHPADYNPYSEGFRKFSLIEKTSGKSKVAELITTGNFEAFAKASADAMIVGARPQEALPSSPPQPRPKIVAPPAEFKKPFLKQLGNVRVRKAQKLMLFAGVAAVILLLFFFSNLFLPPTVEYQVFSTRDLPNPLSPNEYSFKIIANVQSAPMLVESCFVLNSSYSFSEADKIELTLEGAKLPRGAPQLSFEDYYKDNHTDWVARGNWEFFETGNVTIPAKLKIFGSFGAVSFLVYSKILPNPTVDVTFALSGVNAQEGGYSQVLRVDDTPFVVSDLPKIFTWNFGSVHTYNWTDQLAEAYDSRYQLQNISGFASENNATFNVPSTSGNVTAQYSKHFLLRTTVDGDGSVNLPSESWQNENESLTLTATPTSTSAFKNWVINDHSSTENPTQIMINQSFHIDCHFNNIFNVEFNCDLKNTTSTPVLIVDNVEYYPAELPKTFIFEEYANVNFEWHSPVTLSTNNTRMTWASTTGLTNSQSGLLFVMRDGTVSANYTREYLTQINATAGGSLYPDAGTYWYREGEIISLTAYPHDGYSFNYWLVNGVNFGSETSLSIPSTKPLNITAVFKND